MNDGTKDKDKVGKGYQHNLSRQSPILLDPVYKLAKAKKMIAIMQDYLGGETEDLICVDVGSSGGAITSHLADLFKLTVGVDIDLEALAKGRPERTDSRLEYVAGDSMRLPFADESVDVVICNQVYEHVPDPEVLFEEIYRVLKRTGFCYFGAGNRLKIKEPHYHLYFLSWLPKFLADRYMRLMGIGDRYYEDLRTCYGLKKLCSRFEVVDYTTKVLTEPGRYCATDMLAENSWLTRLPATVFAALYFIIPSYIWILRKKRSE